MAMLWSYDRGRFSDFDHSQLADRIWLNLQGEIVSTSSSFLCLHSKFFREFIKVNNTHHAGRYNLRYDCEVFKDLLSMLYPCKNPPIGDAEWNSKVEIRLEMAIKMNIPKLVKRLLTNFNPTPDPLTNALKAIDAHPYLAQFKDANELMENVRRRNIDLSDKTKVLIFDFFAEGDEPSTKRPRLDNNRTPKEAVFFDVDPSEMVPDSRVIVIDGVSILVSTSTLALHSIVFREWFIDDRTRVGPKREAHYYTGIGLKEMTRFLSIVATDTVEDVDESLLDAVYHLQAKYAQVICEEWIWKNHIDAGRDAVNFLKMIIKVRAKYGKLDDAYVLSLAPLIFNHEEQGEVPSDPSAREPAAPTTHVTPLRSMQQVPSHLLTPARTPHTPLKNNLATPAATRPLAANQTAVTTDVRGFEMSLFSSLDVENRARVDRLFTQWEAARLRVVVRDEHGGDHVVHLKHNEARLQDLRIELERICHIPTNVQRILFGAMNLVINKKLVEYGIKNGDKLFVARRDIGNATQTID